MRRQKYNEFVLCLKKNDGDEDECKRARQLALSICPSEWVSFLLFFTIDAGTVLLND